MTPTPPILLLSTDWITGPLRSIYGPHTTIMANAHGMYRVHIHLRPKGNPESAQTRSCEIAVGFIQKRYYGLGEREKCVSLAGSRAQRETASLEPQEVGCGEKKVVSQSF